MENRNRILIEELEKRLLWYREEASGKEFDPEAVDAICTMLQKFSPEKEPHRTKEEAFKNIMRQIRLEEEAGEGRESEDSGGKRVERFTGKVVRKSFGSAYEEECGGESSGRVDERECGRERVGSAYEEERGGESSGRVDEKECGRERFGNAYEEERGGESSGRVDENGFDRKRTEKAGDGKMRRFLLRKSGMRAAVIVIAVAGIFFSLDRVTYARENKSLFTMIMERVGWLEIEKEKGAEGALMGFGEEAGEFYDSWADLDREIKKRISVPTYIPENYSLYGIRCWDFDNRKSIQSNYYNQENGHLLVEITLWEDSEYHYRENASDEKTCVLLSEYSDKDTLYYEAEDEYICLAFMENSFYRISGNITLEDMIKIREGLGDTRPK